MTGLRVLLVEDSPVVAMATEEWLRALGHHPIGPAFRIGTALELIDHIELDCALVDLNIRGEKAFPVMRKLADAGIPFVVTTGYANWQMPEEWEHRPRLAKPYTQDGLAVALKGFHHRHQG